MITELEGGIQIISMGSSYHIWKRGSYRNFEEEGTWVDCGYISNSGTFTKNLTQEEYDQVMNVIMLEEL